jgi:O-antigen/teichoic acid export membrane protein
MIGTWYRTLESTRLIFVSYAFSVIISLAVAYPLISTFGVTGAVVGLLIGQFAQVVFMLAGTTLTRIHRMTL